MTAIHADAVDRAGPLDSTARKALAAATIGYAMDGSSSGVTSAATSTPACQPSAT